MSEFKGGKHCNNGENCPKSVIFGESWQYNSILLREAGQKKKLHILRHCLNWLYPSPPQAQLRHFLIETFQIFVDPSPRPCN